MIFAGPNIVNEALGLMFARRRKALMADRFEGNDALLVGRA
jgi:hypothetical protein